MIVFSLECIPAKNHQADSNRGEDRNNDHPDDGVINIFFSLWVDMFNRTAYQEINNYRCENQPDNAEIFFNKIHFSIFLETRMFSRSHSGQFYYSGKLCQ